MSGFRPNARLKSTGRPIRVLPGPPLVPMAPIDDDPILVPRRPCEWICCEFPDRRLRPVDPYDVKYDG